VTYRFQGETFTTAAAFRRAFPAYRNYADLVLAGADTVKAIEAAIAARTQLARSQALAAARRNNAFTVRRPRA